MNPQYYGEVKSEKKKGGTAGLRRASVMVIPIAACVVVSAVVVDYCLAVETATTSIVIVRV